MKALTHRKGESRARRQRYANLRAQGLPKWDASTAMGGLASDTTSRYERWYQAAAAGQHIIPGTPGPKKAAS